MRPAPFALNNGQARKMPKRHAGAPAWWRHATAAAPAVPRLACVTSA
jgi:hypothetical protein